MTKSPNDGGQNKTPSSNVQGTPESKISLATGMPAEVYLRLSGEFLRHMWDAWGKHRDGALHDDPDKNAGLDHVKYTRLTMVQLAQMAATCAVDVHVDEEAFLSTCSSLYKAAHAKAPKWG